jgi:hypothetical protein
MELDPGGMTTVINRVEHARGQHDGALRMHEDVCDCVEVVTAWSIVSRALARGLGRRQARLFPGLSDGRSNDTGPEDSVGVHIWSRLGPSYSVRDGYPEIGSEGESLATPSESVVSGPTP